MDIKKDSFKAWILAARPKTLTGAAVPVMIALALAWADIHSLDNLTNAQLDNGSPVAHFNWTAAVLCLLFAFIMQIDANFINDYFDFVKGTDDRTTRLGPERACTQGWVSIGRMKLAIAITTILACQVGLPLISYGGIEMVLVGAVCVVFCFLYTTHLSYMGLGDLLVLVFFGLVPVCITYYLQLHTITPQVLTASLACGLVIDALLIVNNFRDRDTDRQAGKRTLVVGIGPKASILLYLGVGIIACCMGIVFMLNGHPFAFILPLLYLLLHFLTYTKMKRIWAGRELNRCLGETARNIFVYGLLVTIGLLI